MTFSIIPNIALGMGVILVVGNSFGELYRLPCKNTATAEYYIRHIKNS